MYIAMLPHAEQKLIAQQHQQQVQDRRTGEYHSSQKAFDRLMNTPELLAQMQRLSIR